MVNFYYLGSKKYCSNVLLDTGSAINLLSKRFVQEFCYDCELQKDSDQVFGIEGRPVSSEGTITFDLRISNCLFPSVKFTVLDTKVPNILGRDFLNRCTEVTFDVTNNRVRFANDSDSGLATLVHPNCRKPSVNLVGNNELQAKIDLLCECLHKMDKEER